MIIPIIVAAISLGRSFDMVKVNVKDDYIFDNQELTKNIIVIPKAFTHSQYRLLESSSDVNDFLNIHGELSLKVKKGDINLEGYGDYLKKTVDRTKTVEMLITVYHETQTDTFPSYTKLRSEWQSKPQSAVGTHYIRSITYGGQLMISYKLHAKKTEFMEEIKAAVTANLAMSGKLDANVKGNMEKLSKEVAEKASVEIKAFATAGVFSPPQNIEQALKLVEAYPKMVEKLNSGKGSPLKLELVELSTLKFDYEGYLKNLALEGMLNEATNKFDDLRITDQEYKAWEKRSRIWTDKQQKMVSAFSKPLKQAMKAFRAAITKLDPTGGLNQFDQAFKAYGENEANIPNKYSRELQQLLHKVDNIPFHWYPYTTAISHFIHWGSLNCTLPSSEPVYIGYAATSPKGFGNGGNVQCLRNHEPALQVKKLSEKTVISRMNGIKYELPDETTGNVLCSFCRLENATTAFTISGRTTCPSEMKLEYSGYLMTSKDAGTAFNYICLDQNPDQFIPGQMMKVDSEAATLIPMWMKCPDCDEDENKKYVNCIVCSR